MAFEGKVSGMDFDPDGEKIALIDYYARCSIVDIDTDASVYNVELGGKTASNEMIQWSDIM